ncbi:hypothetical protein LCGC14_2585540 [marine sediment metagenome]|uniref:Uncharacterized protein n=1 Tax=marine sediment metagenome TaxID=412755 RepID=A0A0F9CP88_9ZZZZ
MSKVIDVTMKFKKSTPGTHVFREVPNTEFIDGPGELTASKAISIPVLYIRKTALTEPAQEIRVTVEILK